MRNSVYKRHINNFSNHWWFQARKKIIEEIIKKKIKKKLRKNFCILDFGSGSGINVKMLSKFGFVNIYEPHQETRKYLQTKDSDKKKFRVLNKNLNQNGHILITVPAYQFLFSSKDMVLKHFRRYRKQEIKGIFKKND